MIRLLVADDESLMRSGIVMMLSAEPDLSVVAQAANGQEAIDAAAATTPDVALLDVRMPVVDGVAAARAIAGSGLITRVLMLTTFDDEDDVHAALRAGAAGFVLKHAAPAELVMAVRRVASGEGWLDPAIVPRLVQHVTALPDVGVRPPSLDPLTDREVDVLRLIAEGLSNAEIAGVLFLSVGTVKVHVSRVLTKLGLHDRTQAAVVAHRHGLTGRA